MTVQLVSEQSADVYAIPCGVTQPLHVQDLPEKAKSYSVTKVCFLQPTITDWVNMDVIQMEG